MKNLRSFLIIVFCINFILSVVITIRSLVPNPKEYTYKFKDYIALKNPAKYLIKDTLIIENTDLRLSSRNRSKLVVISGILKSDLQENEIILNDDSYYFKYIVPDAKANKLIVYKNTLTNNLFIKNEIFFKSAIIDAVAGIYFQISFYPLIAIFIFTILKIRKK